MTRLQRLCLDAVERLGEPYVATLNVFEYVERRRYWVSLGSMHIALRTLEDLGYVYSMPVADGRRVYKRTSDIDYGERVPLARGAR